MNREDLPHYEQVEKWNEALISNRLNDDPANYPEPSLLDPLEPELEETWSTIASSIQELGGLTVPAMMELWANIELHPAIRDRALLVAIGAWPVKKALGFESMRSTFGGDGFKVDEKTKDEYQDKVRKIIDAQHNEGLELFDQRTYLRSLLTYFQGNKMDATTFEDYLMSVNIRKAQPKYCEYGPGFVFYAFDELEYSRFPLLTDIFIGMYGNEKKHMTLFNWAYDKLEQWLEHRVDPNAPPSSPEWFDWVDDFDDRHTYKLCNWLLVHTEDSKGHVNERSRELMIQYFGWEILYTGSHMLAYGHDKLTLGEGIEIAESLTDETEKSKLLEYVLLRNQKLRDEPEESAQWNRRLEPYAAVRDVEVNFLKSALKNMSHDNPITELIKQELTCSDEAIKEKAASRQKMLDEHAANQRVRDEKAATERARKQKAASTLDEALKKSK